MMSIVTDRYFRSLTVAASLKVTNFDALNQESKIFPQPNGCGLIEGENISQKQNTNKLISAA